MQKKDFFKIIDRFLNGEANENDLKTIKHFEHFAQKNSNTPTFKNAREKEEIRKQILHKVLRKVGRKKLNMQRIYIAASLTLLIGLSIFLLKHNFVTSQKNILVRNEDNKAKIICMPDMSEITLNVNSSISYTEDFNKRNRKLTLKGEAIFNVKPNTSLPFTIQTGKLTTQVVGTIFSIKESGQSINVSVIKGKVKVFNKKDTVSLTPNQRIIFNQESESIKEEAVNSNILNLWTKEAIVLNDITYKELSEVFYDLFRYKIYFDKQEIADTRLSIAFHKSESIKEIIDRVNIINKVKLTLKSNNMIIAE